MTAYLVPYVAVAVSFMTAQEFMVRDWKREAETKHRAKYQHGESSKDMHPAPAPDITLVRND
jgi:hypothetical protein